ncbi:MAG TPA: AMP-binding protein [Acidimicrobiales bacterium]|nr:AMP-binding protein [Acidimicrobiales bacterium]
MSEPIVSGPLSSEPIYEVDSIWELVRRRADATPDAPMLLDENDRRLTFGEFRDKAERVAAGLAELGVGRGTVVSWQLPTRMETVLASMALARLGAVQNPIIHLYREREVGFALRQLSPELFLCPTVFKDFDFAEMGRCLGSELERPPRVIDAYSQLPDGDPSSLPPPPDAASANQVRWVYYTSGTTSDPKGVRHSDRTLVMGGKGLAAALGMSPGDVGSMAFPFAHIAGPDYLVMVLALGFPVVLLESFVPDDATRVFSRHSVTMAGGSTAFYQAFLNVQRERPDEPIIPSLRMLSGGGAPMPPEIFNEVGKELGVRVAHGYGMTEIPMICMGSPRDSDEQLMHTVGKPVLGAEVRVVGNDGSLASAGVDGEIRVRGEMVCKGYTDEALNADAFDEEGFFRTGDLGHLRPDGHVVLTGRLKDVIIRKGENISAKEIEDLLYEHPKVLDVAVIGLPDRERGERVCAVVQRAPDEAPLELEEMVKYLRSAGLMPQKVPEQLEVVDALPRNETLNKVLKQKLRDQYSTVPWSG